MPRYDYECRKCNMMFELGCTIERREEHESGRKKIKCPVCKRSPLHQVLSPVRFSVK